MALYGKRFAVGGVALVAAAALIVPATGLAATTVSGLEANANSAPLGIDDATPTLSWRLSATERGALQSKYQVVVATTAARAAAGTGDVWDSGQVSSDRNTAVYGGPALTSRTRYYWSVRSWTGATASAWAPAAWFETAYLSPSQWQGTWIAGPERLAVVPTRRRARPTTTAACRAPARSPLPPRRATACSGSPRRPTSSPARP